MTRSEWDQAMERWLHRKDLTADLDTIFNAAAAMVRGALLQPGPLDLDKLLETNGELFLHAGLAYGHTLVQDDAGYSRELGNFNRAVGEYAMRRSLDLRPQATSTRPYYDAVGVSDAT